MEMDYLKSHYNILSSSLFVLLILAAHLFSTQQYDWTKNTISDLGAQGYDRKWIMQCGFLAFGIILVAGVLLNGFAWRTLPILLYALCVGLTGVFCEKPFFHYEPYSVAQASIHSILAQTAGVAFSIGILVQLFYTPDNSHKWIHFGFFILVIGLSAAFGLTKSYPGIPQRLLYLVSLLWLVGFYKP